MGHRQTAEPQRPEWLSVGGNNRVHFKTRLPSWGVVSSWGASRCHGQVRGWNTRPEQHFLPPTGEGARYSGLWNTPASRLGGKLRLQGPGLQGAQAPFQELARFASAESSFHVRW